MTFLGVPVGPTPIFGLPGDSLNLCLTFLRNSVAPSPGNYSLNPLPSPDLTCPDPGPDLTCPHHWGSRATDLLEEGPGGELGVGEVDVLFHQLEGRPHVVVPADGPLHRVPHHAHQDRLLLTKATETTTGILL